MTLLEEVCHWGMVFKVSSMIYFLFADADVDCQLLLQMPCLPAPSALPSSTIIPLKPQNVLAQAIWHSREWWQPWVDMPSQVLLL